jgi:exopolysaccharide production protein ExoQ
VTHYIHHCEIELPPRIGNAVAEPLTTSRAHDRRDDRWHIIAIDIAIMLGLFLCFGSIVVLVAKVQNLKEAPSWAVYLYALPIAATALLVALRPQSAIRTALVGGPFFVFIVWCLASFQWSNQPALTMRQGLLMCATYATACMVAQYLSWVRVGRILAGLFTLQAVISAFLALFKPEWGVMTEIYPGSWSGIWSFKQTLGVAMAVGVGGVTGYVLLRPKAWVWCVPALMIMGLCLIKSQATTAILASGLAFAMPCALWVARRSLASSVFVTWALSTSILIGTLAVTILAPLIFQALGKAPTLTGRIDIWAALQSSLHARPWLGWGFQAFWTDMSLTSPVEGVEQAMDGFRPPDAHSTPIDVHLQLGYVGLFLIAMSFVLTWAQALWRLKLEPGMLVVIGILTAITAMGFTEAIGLYPMDSMTLVIHIIIVKTSLSAFSIGARHTHGVLRGGFIPLPAQRSFTHEGLKGNGASDGARTRDPRRDRPVL